MSEWGADIQTLYNSYYLSGAAGNQELGVWLSSRALSKFPTKSDSQILRGEAMI